MAFRHVLDSKITQNGYTVKTLAEEIGVTQQLLYLYLADERMPKPETLVKIARALGQDPLHLAKYVEPRREGRPRSQRHKPGPKIRDWTKVTAEAARRRLKNNYIKAIKAILSQEAPKVQDSAQLSLDFGSE